MGRHSSRRKWAYRNSAGKQRVAKLERRQDLCWCWARDLGCSVCCVLPSSGNSPAVYEWVPDLEKLEAEEHQEHEFWQPSIQENNRGRGWRRASYREDCSDWPCLSCSKYSSVGELLPSLLSSHPIPPFHPPSSLRPFLSPYQEPATHQALCWLWENTDLLKQVMGVPEYQGHLLPRGSSCQLRSQMSSCRRATGYLIYTYMNSNKLWMPVKCQTPH